MEQNPYTLLEKSGALATITLNRPQHANALSVGMRASLQERLDEVAQDSAIDVVLLQSAGKIFCGGLDVTDMPNDPTEWRNRVLAAQKNHLSIVRMPKVVIAAVQGIAVGGGASLALAADILIMADNASLSFPFVHLGIVPDGGSSYFLQSKLGTPLALDLLLTGGKMTAAEAAAQGLTRRITTPETLAESSAALAKELGRVAPEARMLTKSLCQQYWATDLEAALRHEADAFAYATSTDGHQAAMQRLQEARRKSSSSSA